MLSIASKKSLLAVFHFLIALERGYSSLKIGLVWFLRVLKNLSTSGDIKSSLFMSLLIS